MGEPGLCQCDDVCDVQQCSLIKSALFRTDRVLIKANLVFTVLSADVSKSILQIICVRLFMLLLGVPVWRVLLTPVCLLTELT